MRPPALPSWWHQQPPAVGRWHPGVRLVPWWPLQSGACGCGPPLCTAWGEIPPHTLRCSVCRGRSASESGVSSTCGPSTRVQVGSEPEFPEQGLGSKFTCTWMLWLCLSRVLCRVPCLASQEGRVEGERRVLP